jgi:conjugal transfer pilus assembly protein TraF
LKKPYPKETKNGRTPDLIKAEKISKHPNAFSFYKGSIYQLPRDLVFVSIVFITVTSFVSNTQAQEPAPTNHKKTYYEKRMQGWWWYEKEPERTDQAEQPTDTTLQRRLPSLADYSKDELWKMHPDDFQPLLKEFLKKAVMSPTMENVHEYYLVQDIARRKSLAFANVAATLMQTRADLSVASAYPVAVPGINARERLQRNEIEQKIRASKTDFALLYFYSYNCQYCEEQDKILTFFSNKYGWEVKPLEIDSYARLASHFSVSTVPYLLLIYKDSRDSIPISAGLISLSDMERKIYRGIRLLTGEIRPEEYSLYEFQRGGVFDPTAPLKSKLLKALPFRPTPIQATETRWP